MKGNGNVVSQNHGGCVKHKNYQLKKEILMLHSGKDWWWFHPWADFLPPAMTSESTLH